MNDSQVKGPNFNFSMIHNEVIDLNLDPFALSVYVILARHANREYEAFPSIDTIGEKLAGSALVDDPDDPPKPLSRPTVSRALNRLVRLGLIEITPRFLPNGGRTSNGYTILPVEKRTPTNVAARGVGQPDLHPPTNDVYSNKTPESEVDSESNKKSETSQLTLSEEDAAFWEMFSNRHWTIFARTYNGPCLEMDANPTLRALAELDPAERMAVVQQALQALAASGPPPRIAAWATYEPEIRRAFDDLAQRTQAAALLRTFTLNLNEALVRLGMPTMSGLDYTAAQRQKIAEWGHLCDADALEAAIIDYPRSNPNDRKPFSIRIKLDWVIVTAKNAKLDQASGAAPGARNGNHNGNHNHNGTAWNGARGNPGGARGQANGGQPTLAEWDKLYEKYNGA